MDKKFWISIEKQWRKVVSSDLLATAIQSVEKDVLLIGKNNPIGNIWECLDDDDDE